MMHTTSFYAPFRTVERLLGEPQSVEVLRNAGGTTYRRATFPCGCSASGVADSAICFPCRGHEPLRAFIGVLAPI
jgi:hypothetical protein